MKKIILITTLLCMKIILAGKRDRDGVPILANGLIRPLVDDFGNNDPFNNNVHPHEDPFADVIHLDIDLDINIPREINFDRINEWKTSNDLSNVIVNANYLRNPINPRGRRLDVSNIRWQNIDINNTQFYHLSFINPTISHVHFINTVFEDVSFANCNLQNNTFTNTTLFENVNFSNADLTGTSFTGCTIFHGDNEPIGLLDNPTLNEDSKINLLEARERLEQFLDEYDIMQEALEIAGLNN